MTAPAKRSQRATPKVRRWTDLIAALLRHRFPIPFDEIARQVPDYADESRPLETRKRMFERDKQELLRVGVPLQTAPDEHGQPTLYTIRRTAFYLPYLTLVAPGGTQTTPRHGRVARDGYQALATLAFEPDELAAVADAAARVAALGDPVLAHEVEGAMRKLVHDLPVGATAAPAAPHVVPPRPHAASATFDTLDGALRDRRRVTFAYRAMTDGESAVREVEPWGLFYLHGHWYLAGRDGARDALRNFRLDRMHDVAPAAAGDGAPDYDVPADFRLREHARSRQAWELGDGDAEDVEVEFARETGPSAAAARLGSPMDGHPTRRRFTVRRQDAFVRWLLALAGDARPVAPASLVRAYADQARRALDVYADDAVEHDA